MDQFFEPVGLSNTKKVRLVKIKKKKMELWITAMVLKTFAIDWTSPLLLMGKK